MKLIYNILVIVNPQQDNDPTLNRAMELAKAINAHIHLLICSNTRENESLLKDLTYTLQQKNFKASSEIAWHDSYHKTITTIQKTQHIGLVLKQQTSTKSISNVILTPEDWKLLRTCNCPILIINQNKPWGNRPILTAVDLGSPDENHIELHNSLVKAAYALTLVSKGSLHLLSVYPSPIFSEIRANSGLEKIPNEIYNMYYDIYKKYQDQYVIPPDNIHLHAGAPDVVIPKIAQSIDAAVCVIGTVARTGLSGMFIGNTAEAILDDLTCDILIIKPEGISEEIDQILLNHQKKCEATE